MTIVVGIATSEGLVLASDSRTTYLDKGHHRVASDNAQKLFKVSGLGVATWGSAFLGDDTIAGTIDQFAASLDEENLELDQFSQWLGKFMQERLDKWIEAAKPQGELPENFLGFHIAGYDDQGIGHIHTVSIPGPKVSEETMSTTNPGVIWQGQTDVISRLVKGFDWGGFTWNGDADDLPDDFIDHLRQLEYIPIDPITIQDGIDYAHFLIRTTIDMQRFSDGTYGNPQNVPGCGGPTQILAIERRGLSWVSALTLAAPRHAGLAEGTHFA